MCVTRGRPSVSWKRTLLTLNCDWLSLVLRKELLSNPDLFGVQSGGRLGTYGGDEAALAAVEQHNFLVLVLLSAEHHKPSW